VAEPKEDVTGPQQKEEVKVERKKDEKPNEVEKEKRNEDIQSEIAYLNSIELLEKNQKISF